MNKKVIRTIALFILNIFFVSVMGGCIGQRGDESPITENYTFDAQGKLLARTMPDGSKISFNYNDTGRLMKVSGKGWKTDFGYDERYNLASVKNSECNVFYKYDEFNRPSEVTYSNERNFEKKVCYDYDPWSRVVSLKVLSLDKTEYQVKYGYDLTGNLLSIDDGAGKTTYSYDRMDNKVVRSLPNGITSTFKYQAGGLLDSLEHKDAAGGLITSYAYKYDGLGRITEIAEKMNAGDRITGYRWNENGFLSGTDMPDGSSIDYTYDSVGNITGRTDGSSIAKYNFDAFGRLTAADGKVFSYDKNGNMNLCKGLDKDLSLSYNATGQLSGLNTSDGRIKFGYDGLGNLVSSQSSISNSNKIDYFLPSAISPAGCPISEYNTQGNKFYTYGDSLLSVNNNGTADYFLEDGLGLIRQTVDAGGKVIGKCDYTPFGEISFSEGKIPEFSMVGLKNLNGTGLSLMGNKPYDPGSGRFLTPGTGSPDTPQGYTAPQIYRVDYTAIPFGFTHNFHDKCIAERELALAQATPENLFSKVITATVYNVGAYISSIEAVQFAASISTFSLGSTSIIRNIWDCLKFSAGVVPSVSQPEWKDVNFAAKFIGAAGTLISATDGIQNLNKALGYRFLGDTANESKCLLTAEQVTKKLAIGKIPDVLKIFDYESPSSLNIGMAGEADNSNQTIILKGLPPYFSGEIPVTINTDPLKTVDKDLGGISLDTAARTVGNFDLGSVSGVVWDEDKQCLVLLGDEDTDLPSVSMADLAAAIKSIFGYHTWPYFSLDPADPQNPSGPDIKAVYGGAVEDTAFGQAMYDADWKLKEYSFGVTRDAKGGNHKVNSAVPGYKSIIQRSFENSDNLSQSYMRFWITCEDAPIFKTEDGIYFGPVKMKVNTEKMYADRKSKTGLSSSGGKQDPQAEKFAAHFTEHYDEFAKEEPSFGKVREMAKAVAIAEWMYEKGFTPDMDWVDECLRNTMVDTPETVKALDYSESRESTEGRTINTLQISLHGGVDLSVKPDYKKGSGPLPDLKPKISEKLTSSNDSVFDIDNNGEKVKAVVLPITKEGKARWGDGYGGNNKDGIRYSFNGGRVTKADDGKGNSADFIYGQDGHIDGVTWKLAGGLQASAKKEGSLTTLDILTSSNDKLTYRYETSGNLDEVSLNGKRYAKIKPLANSLEIEYDSGYSEKYKMNGKEKTVSYVLSSPGQGDQMYETKYDSKGRLSDMVSGDGEDKLLCTYKDDNLKAIQFAGGRIDYSYNEGRVTGINTSWGMKVSIEYEGEYYKKIDIENGNANQSLMFSKGCLIETTGSGSKTTSYKYGPEGRLSSAVDDLGSQTYYMYDDANRLKEVELPDGSGISYTYDSDKKQEVSSIKIKTLPRPSKNNFN